MQFTKRNISKQSRNGEIILTRSETFESSTSSSNVGGGVSGNYLPATQSEDGKYVVDLANVQFTGNIYADGEVSAYGQGGGGTTSSGNTEIIDALSSSSVTAALSANQGRVLNDKIITLSGNTYTKAQVDALISGGTSSGNTDLSNYYTKEETYSKTEVDEKISGYTGNYLPANKNADGTYTVDLEEVTFNGRIIATSEISAFGEGESGDGIVVDLSNYYTKDQVYNTGETYNKAQVDALIATNTGVTVDLSNYYTKPQTDSKITSSLSGYATEQWVTNKGYLTSSSLNGYATQTWVESKKYLTGYTLPTNIVYDEDLTNYFTKSEINNTLKGYSLTGHTHAYSELTSTAHTHAYSSITNTGHTHSISNITNLQTTLDGKSGTGHSHNITALTSGKCAYNLYVKKSAAQVVCENSAGNVISLHNDSNRGIYDNTTNKWMIGNNGTNTFLQLGLVGIGTQSPTYKLTVEGGGIKASGNIIAGGEVTALSDARLKKNITPLENVGKLNPVRYIKDGKPSIGFVAQDVRELYPELVEETNTEEKYLAVNYPQITAVLSAQINELYDIINTLKKEIKELKNK